MSTTPYILSRARRNGFDKPTDLDTNRNRGFIAVDSETRLIIRKMSPTNKVGFVLQKAYFHAKGRFFKQEQFKVKHVNMVAACLGINKNKVDIREYAYSTMKTHQNKVLALFNWEKVTPSFLASLELYATGLAEKKLIKEDTLFKLVEKCWESHVTIPNYQQLATIVNSAYTNYEIILEQKISAALSSEQKNRILSIFRDEILSHDFSALCKINQSKAQYDMSKNAIILESFKNWFEACRAANESVDMSRESITYYAETVAASTLPQLRRLTKDENQCLLALSFIIHNFYLRSDSSIDAFLKDLRSTRTKSTAFEKETQNKIRQDLADEESLIIGSAENSTHTLRLVLNVVENEAISLPERNEKAIQLIRSCLSGQVGDLKGAIEELRGERNNIETKKHRYTYLFESGNSLSRKYSQFLPLWVFDRQHSDKDILSAIDYLNDSQTFDSENCPTDFMNDNEIKLVFEDDSPIITKYRTLLFSKLEKAIRNKHVTLVYSYRFKDPGSTFIPDSKWSKDMKALCYKSGLDSFLNVEGPLKNLGDSVYDLFAKLNDAIESKENTHVQRHPKGGWKYDLPKADYSTEKFIPKLLSGSNSYVTLLNVIREVDYYSNFTDYFVNRRVTGGKAVPSKKHLYAALYSLSTNNGHHETVKMADGLTEKQLRDAETSYFSIKSLKNVNKCLIEFIHSLNLPMLYVDKDRVVHTSSDGKKLIVDVDSLLANYSFKYYGKESGINVLNFVDPKQISFNVNILPSSDREAPYMLDGLIESADKLWELYEKGDHDKEADKEFEHIHSSDTHGYTEAVFAALWFKGVLLQPHIAKLWEHKLVGYDSKCVKDNKRRLVEASRYINKTLIITYWNEMLRIMCSVILGYCPAHLVFRQLSAGAAYHPVYKAFQELGRLVRTKATLRYLENEELRRDVRKYLNRSELGQKFGRAIFHGREGKLQVGSPSEIEKAMLCQTIAMNCVIAWNYLSLSDHYNNLTSNEQRKEASEMIRSGSVMSHAHVNMGGALFFDDDASPSFESTLEEMRNITIVE